MKRQELQAWLDALMACRVKDYCPNGLQVEGRGDVRRVLTGVTASLALIEEAVAWQADAIIVHHGLFWRGDDGRVTGHRRARLAGLLGSDINLFAYHLPLDLHPELGNNVQLARLLGWREESRCGEQDLVFVGSPAQATTAGEVAAHVASVLGREPMLIGEPAREVRRIAWCTGAAQSSFEQAIIAGVDMYVSGEISEPTVHLARESGVAYLAAGHHATERYGVRALGERIASELSLEVRFVDLDNPV